MSVVKVGLGLQRRGSRRRIGGRSHEHSVVASIVFLLPRQGRPPMLLCDDEHSPLELESQPTKIPDFAAPISRVAQRASVWTSAEHVVS